MEAKLRRPSGLPPRSPAMRLGLSVASAAASSENGRVAEVPRVDPVVRNRGTARGNKGARQGADRNLTRACRRRAWGRGCSEVAAWRIIVPCQKPSRLWARA